MTNIDGLNQEEIEARQRAFSQSPEFKKREIVFSQIQQINVRLSNLEANVEEILNILKANN
ncbi:MAG TPA: hypothetical protein VFG45_05025 [Candidatus Nitrosocosmicus sp.]|uniref:hypothetical protein n=1 Tax=Candidatus Nitrosocosmicus agrestis TaxID=2563600 RepID=UPI00122E8854|nr:hypothetical protein [Candidatus Nitrosocosmicus sp. SS]KAA2279546.1 hypothetical protein F1Z66_13220 [Candidatus Nitrosocosmicus sp. SS]KAF0868172.1 hypothetical protein E5N71_11545 [Candidatus Nitrosocosmicus sp. SS]HET6589509.1 hypothetical protein [Candidatus Nitrosocosmicus sp.]